MQKTFSPKGKEITRDWHVIDASGIPLGRLASQVAQLLRGKHKPTFAPHLDTGDHVIVVNAERVALTGASSIRRCTTDTRATRAASARRRSASSLRSDRSAWWSGRCAG